MFRYWCTSRQITVCYTPIINNIPLSDHLLLLPTSSLALWIVAISPHCTHIASLHLFPATSLLPWIAHLFQLNVSLLTETICTLSCGINLIQSSNIPPYCWLTTSLFIFAIQTIPIPNTSLWIPLQLPFIESSSNHLTYHIINLMNMCAELLKNISLSPKQ